MEEVVCGPVVRDLLESDPRSMPVRRDCSERVYIRRESTAERSEGGVPTDRVADGKVEGDRGDERDEVTRGEGIVVEALPESTDLRNGPMAVLREFDAGVGREVELDAALLGDDPIVRQQHAGPHRESELAGASDSELGPEEMVVFGVQPQADGALLAVQDPDELADLPASFTLTVTGGNRFRSPIMLAGRSRSSRPERAPIHASR